MAADGTSAAPRVPGDYTSGVVLIVLGTVAFSSAGLFVRILGKDAATTLFWRGIFTALAIVAFIVWRERERTFEAFWRIGRAGLWIAVFQAASMACFLTSLQYTTVANNSIIFGTGPFITAGLAWLLIGERPTLATLLFSAIALLGAVIVMGGSFSIVNPNQLIGDGLAVLMTVAFAIKTVLIRQHRDVPMVPSACLGVMLGSLGAIPFVETWTLSLGELGLFALFGFTQQGAGLILTTIGVQRVPAAHSALLMALDLPLAPLWVWLALGERPGPLSLIGGAIVLAAILGHILVTTRARRG